MPNLAGCTIVITRPLEQAFNLNNRIVKAGGNALCFPVMQIQPIEISIVQQRVLDQLDQFDIAIFISVNAVTHGIKHLASLGTTARLQIAAVGLATQRALQEKGIKTDISPSTHYNSEALLELDALHQVENKKIIIFRGQGGRELLAQTLISRGAQVDYIECYRRSKADTDVHDLMALWKHGRIDAIIVTSEEGLNNLYDIVGSQGRPYLLKDQLIVFSQRIADSAKTLKFTKTPLVTATASDDAIIELIFSKFGR